MINRMTENEQRNIDRLIESGTPENLSLTYHLMVGLGVDDVEAVHKILSQCYYHGLFSHCYMMVWDNYMTPATFYLFIHKADNGKTQGQYISKERIGNVLNMSNVCAALTKTRHIWQDKI